MNVFDIIGPVMIGPSSSHTAGAARIGNIAAALLQGNPVKAKIGLCGSFAKTGKGHGTDRALVAGVMGMLPSDPRIKNSLEEAKKRGIEISFENMEIEGAHPNTALIYLEDAEKNHVTVQGASVGGGNILISKINDMPVDVTGSKPTLLIFHRDVPGVIAKVTNFLAEGGSNICGFKLSRRKKGDMALMTIETDNPLNPSVVKSVRSMPHIISCVMLYPTL